eukprot:5455380-Pyramimonas_sp.AAC.1
MKKRRTRKRRRRRRRKGGGGGREERPEASRMPLGVFSDVSRGFLGVLSGRLGVLLAAPGAS